MEEILLFNNFFPIDDTCLSCEDIARQSCAMVRRCRFLWPPCVAEEDTIFLPCGFFLFFFLRLISVAWLARNTGRKNEAKNRHLGTIVQLCRAQSSQLRHVSTIGKKNLLNSNVSHTCPHNIVNFGPLAAEICWRVWGTSANFNGFRILTVLLHGTLVVGVSQTL